MKTYYISSYLLLILLFIGAKGCKVAFDKEITCPSFHAKDVAVWKEDENTYNVIYSDGRQSRIDSTGCLILIKTKDTK